jgi:hypothetical protein
MPTSLILRQKSSKVRPATILAPYSVTIKKKEQQIPKVTIDEIEYDTEDLTENGRAQLASLQFLEGQMQNIKQEVAVYQTAQEQAASAQELKEEIAKAGLEPKSETPYE